MASPFTVPFANYLVYEKASGIIYITNFPDVNCIHGCIFGTSNSVYSFEASVSCKSPFPDHLTLYMKSETKAHSDLPVHFIVSILDVSKRSHFTKGFTLTFRQLREATFTLNLTRQENILAQADIFLRSHDTLEVAVEALILEKTDFIQASPLLSGLAGLLEDGTCSDFLIAIPGKEYKVHKNILAARSPVFRAMLEGEFRESTENRVDLEKIEPQVFDAFIRYLYTDQITDMKTNALELIVLADKYQVESLLHKCGQYLCSQVSVDSFASLLTLSHQHNVPNLKGACLAFFAAHGKEIVSLDDWDTFTVANLPLLPSLLKALALKEIGEK